MRFDSVSLQDADASSPPPSTTTTTTTTGLGLSVFKTTGEGIGVEQEKKKKKPDDEYGRARAFACYIIRSISGKIECITPPEPEVQAQSRRGGRMCGGEDQNGVSRAPCLL